MNIIINDSISCEHKNLYRLVAFLTHQASRPGLPDEFGLRGLIRYL